MVYRALIRLAVAVLAVGLVMGIHGGRNLVSAKSGPVTKRVHSRPDPAEKLVVDRTPPVAKTDVVTKRPPTPAIRGDEERYPYLGVRFSQFVAESYHFGQAGNPRAFFEWMDKAYRECGHRYAGQEQLNLGEFLRWKRDDLRKVKDTDKKAQAEIELAQWIHKMVKKSIPRFSLDRGFEFHYTVSNGERQCFLQSVLISGMLQEMGLDAGVEMVYRNIGGAMTNNGHAITLLKLPDGRDVIVDASEPDPFARHRGLFVRMADYQYVNPIFEKDSDLITGYKSAAGGNLIPTQRVRTMDIRFLRSQFWYYRGERTKGALILTPKTPEGLEAAENALRTSVRLCPKNPLSVYMLGRVYMAEGKTDQAGHAFRNAYDIYRKSGWVPAGARDAYARSIRP